MFLISTKDYNPLFIVRLQIALSFFVDSKIAGLVHKR
jgi:hypothetical protein